jgi:hypothetical protein
MTFTHGSLVRGAADECLRSVFGDEYGALPVDRRALDSLLIDDLIDLANEDGLDSLYLAAEVLRDRIRPATLAGYAQALAAGRQAAGPDRR